MNDTSGVLIASYCRDSAHRGLMDTTIEMRDARLRAFATWLDPTPISNATEADVERFLAERDIGDRTRYAWLSHLSCFYRWGVRRGHFAADPTVNIDRPRLPRLLPRPVATDALTVAIATAGGPLRAMILLAAYMGLRCREIAALHVNDLVLIDEQMMVVVQGKGRKERIVPMHPEVLAALSPLPKRGWLFTTPDGQPYTAQRVSRKGSHHLHWHGINATMHQLRHWFGTQLYAGTHDLRLTQELMGHADPATTAAYTAWSKGQASEAVRQVGIG